jgi:glycosyltransferase
MKISIITATYNASATLADNLLCIGGQSLAVEHLLIDGQSTDGTLAIAEKQGGHLVKIVSEPDLGIYDAMNKGISLASGEIIGILNADDLYSSSYTLRKIEEVFKDPSVDACYGDLVYVKGVYNGQESIRDKFKVLRYWKSGHFNPLKFYWGWMPPHPTFFVRRSLYEKYGVFNLDLGSAADYELMLRFIFKHRINVAYIPEVLVKMRVGGVSNASLANRLRANQMDRKAWEVNDLKPYPWTLWMKPLRKLPQWWQRPPQNKL